MKAITPILETEKLQKESTHPFITEMDRKIEMVIHDIEKTELYSLLFSPETSLNLTASIVKYIMLEVFSYGPHVTEASFMAISRFPKEDIIFIKPLVKHILSETGHGEMALDDFVKLGGNEHWARKRKITPASFAVGAICRTLAQHESPFAYLGYMYLFETLTPILAERLIQFLKLTPFPKDSLGFIDLHAKEDIAHTKLLQRIIASIVDRHLEAGTAIKYGFDCFSIIYPFAVWNAALANAKAEIS